MRRGISLLAVFAVCVGLSGVGRSDVPPKDQKDPVKPKDDLKLPTKKELMAAKLKHSQSILEGIALNDFDKVSDAGAELVRVARANDFLNAYKGEEYRFHLSTFQRAADAVGKKAAAKNMDGVMVAYNDLTLSCLKCHQAMRDKKFDAALPLPTDKAGK